MKCLGEMSMQKVWMRKASWNGNNIYSKTHRKWWNPPKKIKEKEIGPDWTSRSRKSSEQNFDGRYWIAYAV